MTSDSASWDTLQARLAEIDQISPETVRAVISRGNDGRTDLVQEAIGQSARILFFGLGLERYGARVDSVESITRVSRITSVPNAPRYYRGVTSLHGRILSVLDPSIYLGLPPSDLSGGFVVVMKGSGLTLGFLASEIYDLIDLPLHELSPVDSVGLEREFVVGIIPRKLILLDVEAILARESARINAGANR